MNEPTNNEQQAGPFWYETITEDDGSKWYRLMKNKHAWSVAHAEQTAKDVNDLLNSAEALLDKQAAEIERLRGAFKECVELASNAITGPVTIIDPAAEADHANE